MGTLIDAVPDGGTIKFTLYHQNTDDHKNDPGGFVYMGEVEFDLCMVLSSVMSGEESEGWYQLELGDGIDPAYLPYDTMSGMIHVGFSFDFESEYCHAQEEIAPQPALGGSAPRRNR